MTVLNTAMTRLVRDHIVANPEAHDQSIWMNECGTVGCTAGWAVTLSGNYRQRACDCCSSCSVTVIVDRNGVQTSFDAAAMRELGLTKEEKSYLFYECDDQEAVWYLDWLLAGNRGVPEDA